MDYPLVEELDKIADKFAREDKGPQPAVTHYRGLATVEMPVATGRYPTTRCAWWSWSRKPDANISFADILPICVIRLLAIANVAIYARIAAVLSILASSG